MRYIFFLLFSGIICYAQEPTIKTDLPTVIPPSPTVAGLMKFEEVPVNNYTGIPDISIPLYSVGTHSKDITINLSLNYHPASTAADEEASYVGLGWNLNGGGTISRTVKGLPDDCVKIGGTISETRIGLYATQGAYPNKYYEVINLLGNIQNTGPDFRKVNKFLWDAYELGTYDSEHDLYQFNFMGHSGRFYISMETDQLKIMKLDNDNSIKITYDEVQKIFTAYDDKGYRFVFDVKEITSSSSFVQLIPFDSSSGMPAPSQPVNVPDYISAFHLSKIYDPNNKLLVEYSYNDDSFPIVEKRTVITTKYATFADMQPTTTINRMNGDCPGSAALLEPKETKSRTDTSIETKKIRSINIVDKAKIEFSVVADRQDTNLNYGYSLSEITVKAPDSSIVKKVIFGYDYSRVNLKTRMMLSSVTHSNASGSITEPYVLEYTSYNNYLGFGVDYWGYYNRTPASYQGVYLGGSSTIVKSDVLQKMTLPTGGAIIYNFESNTYSSIGSEPLSNFDDNVDNWSLRSIGHEFNTEYAESMNFSLGVSSQERILRVSSNSDVDGAGNHGNVMLRDNTIGGGSINVSCGRNNGSCFSSPVTLIPGHTYEMWFSWMDVVIDATCVVNCQIKERASVEKKYLYGGGVRIKNIGYFENKDVDIDYYDHFDSDLVPSKQKNYSYSVFNDPLRSSGSLSFPLPVYDYSATKLYYTTCLGSENGFSLHHNYVVGFNFHTNTNNLKVQKTKGSDVGYQNVTVSETGNGYSQFVYTSPIDYPEENYMLTYPFFPPISHDDKRGLLKKETTYSQTSQILSQTIYDYEIVTGNKNTGLMLASSVSKLYWQRWSSTSYDFYANMVELCNETSQVSICPFVNGYPSEYVNYFPVIEAYAWPKLKQKTTKEYLGNQIVETKQYYKYNNLNKRINFQKTETYNAGVLSDSISVTYSYLYNGALGLANRIGEIDNIQTKKNGVLTAKQKILYNNLYQPQTIQASKGEIALENRMQFVSYDEYSNPLEVKLENGISTVYIWGYNKTQPVAMIENSTHAAIPPNLIAEVTAASNSYAADAETNLRDKLNELRNALPNAMVTTYTYKPLVGVSTITNPAGDITSYEYDTFGRLLLVKDNFGKVLSKNDYHYRP
jgi:YD repeat-containing protein